MRGGLDFRVQKTSWLSKMNLLVSFTGASPHKRHLCLRVLLPGASRAGCFLQVFKSRPPKEPSERLTWRCFFRLPLCQVPAGLRYLRNFIDQEEERELLEILDGPGPLAEYVDRSKRESLLHFLGRKS